MLSRVHRSFRRIPQTGLVVLLGASCRSGSSVLSKLLATTVCGTVPLLTSAGSPGTGPAIIQEDGAQY